MRFTWLAFITMAIGVCTFYNTHRPHSTLDGRTPDQAYFNQAYARSGSGVTKADIHIENAGNLFKQTEPPLVAPAANDMV